MAFNARLDIIYSYIDNPPNEIFISSQYIDLLGLYVGDSIVKGFRIIQDITGCGFAKDTLVYEIIENNGSLDGGVSYNLRAKWALDGDPIELQAGQTTIIGEADIYGVVDVPEANSQMMDAVAINRIRNYISRIPKTTQVISSNRFSGELNGINNIFYTEFIFNPDSVKVYMNGMRLKEGIEHDYILPIDNNSIRTNFFPVASDIMIIEYSR